MALGTTLQQLARGTLQIEEKPKGRIAAGIFSILAIAGLGALFTAVVVLPKVREEPEVIVEVIVPQVQAAPRMQKLNALKSFEKSFAMPRAGAFSRMMKASSKPIEVPGTFLEHYEAGERPLGFGDSVFGEGVGIGGRGAKDAGEEAAVAEEVKTGAALFGLGSMAKRIVYLLDFSAEAGSHRALIERELSQSIRELTPDIQFAVICYGAVPLRLGREKVDMSEDGSSCRISAEEGGKVYLKRDGRYVFRGLPTTRLAGVWSRSTPEAAKDVSQRLALQESMGGHDWYNAFTMAHNLEPKPEAIYFVVASGDGVPEKFREMSAYNRDQGKPAVQGILLGTVRGVREMHALSEASGGKTLVVVDTENLRSVPAATFLENPSNEMQALGEFDEWLEWEKERETRATK